MRSLASLACLLTLVTACGRTSHELGLLEPTAVACPSPATAPGPNPMDGSQAIRLGEQVTGTLAGRGAAILYSLTASLDGTLIVSLTWEPCRGNLALRIDETPFRQLPDPAPIVARYPVVAGQTYRIGVHDGVPWEHGDLVVPFVLTTTFEPSDLQVLQIGEEVTAALVEHGDEALYALTTPADGTLVAELAWDRARGPLEVWIDGTQFLARPGDGSPIIARFPVVAGQWYRIGVFDSNPWDYDDLFIPFVLSITLEPPAGVQAPDGR